mmetsp:Transcript_5812/g.14779  ORF Transcript_5812/g.14779 Transcript_5812/m.14779 type:complete len:399 (-) Transcript_5812:285-1481(-)
MHVVVVGAGSVGCFVGLTLLEGKKTRVSFVCRAHFLDTVTRYGITVGDTMTSEIVDASAANSSAVVGHRRHFPPEKIPHFCVGLSSQYDLLQTADVVLVCVKSSATQSVGEALHTAALPSSALVISLQNGAGNQEILRRCLPSHTVLQAIVGFNVARCDVDCIPTFLRTTDNPLLFEALPSEPLNTLITSLRNSGVNACLTHQLEADRWAKLLINLNNGVNALSGRPLAEELSCRGYRRVLSALIREGVQVLRAAHKPIGRIGTLQPSVLATLLLAPDFLFRLLAKRMISIHPAASSSMQDDLKNPQRNTTEIDLLSGEICRLGRQYAVPTPVNDRMVHAVHEACAKGDTPSLSPSQMEELFLPQRSGLLSRWTVLLILPVFLLVSYYFLSSLWLKVA